MAVVMLFARQLGRNLSIILPKCLVCTVPLSQPQSYEHRCADLWRWSRQREGGREGETDESGTAHTPKLTNFGYSEP